MLALLIPGLLMGTSSALPVAPTVGRIVIPWNNADASDGMGWEGVSSTAVGWSAPSTTIPWNEE